MQIERCSYRAWDNCLEMSNGQVKLIITLDVGPRVIFYGFIDGQNMFKNFDEQMGQTADTEYPDCNCNAEYFTMPGFLEMETFSPLKCVAPGDCLENCETWQLFKVDVSEDEADIDAKILPLI